MAIPKRHGRLPGTYFVTSRAWESRPLFAKSRPCEIFVASLVHYREKEAFLLHEFVLMPDHFHVLLTPAPSTTLERVMQYIKGGSAHRIRQELAYRFPVRQRGFSDHRIRDGSDYLGHVRYIHENPVKEKLAGAPGEYPWSSAAGKWRLDEPPQGLKPLGAAVQYGTAKAVP